MTRFLESDDPNAVEPDITRFCGECGKELTDEEIALNDQDDADPDYRLCEPCFHAATGE